MKEIHAVADFVYGDTGIEPVGDGHLVRPYNLSDQVRRTCCATTKTAFDIPSHCQVDTPTISTAWYPGADAHKVADHMLRWINSRAEKSPLSETAGAAIGASRCAS